MSKFKQIMGLILDEMEFNAESFSDDKVELSPDQFVSEFRTVHLSYGQRIGKTNYILSHANTEDLVLIPETRFRRLYEHLEKDHYPDIYSGSQILNQDEVMTYSVIWVEEPALHNKLDDCLEKLIKNHDQTVIMVGH